jgi:hypothetical protein
VIVYLFTQGYLSTLAQLFEDILQVLPVLANGRDDPIELF